MLSRGANGLTITRVTRISAFFTATKSVVIGLHKRRKQQHLTTMIFYLDDYQLMALFVIAEEIPSLQSYVVHGVRVPKV